jgi:hypothetical protein
MSGKVLMETYEWESEVTPLNPHLPTLHRNPKSSPSTLSPHFKLLLSVPTLHPLSLCAVKIPFAPAVLPAHPLLIYICMYVLR